MNDFFMKKAISQAKKAQKLGEVPVGAIIVKNNMIIASGYNKRESKQNPIFHAEILAILKACKKLNSFRLDGCEMYVTLEPCPMCAGAIINSRIKKVYIGALDKNYGCAGSKYNLLNDKCFEHTVQVETGILKEKCENLLNDFFVQIREQGKIKKYLGEKFNCCNKNKFSNISNIKLLYLDAKNKEEYYVVAVIKQLNSNLLYLVLSSKLDFISYSEIKKIFNEKFLSKKLKITTLDKNTYIF